jgi:hypothetical protein
MRMNKDHRNCWRWVLAALGGLLAQVAFGQSIVYVHAPLSNPSGDPNHLQWDSLGTQVGPDFPIIINGQTVLTLSTPQVLGQPSALVADGTSTSSILCVGSPADSNAPAPISFVAPLSAGQEIGPNLAGYSFSSDGLFTASTGIGVIEGPSQSVGYFTGLQSAYAGFQFEQSGETHYGWMRIGCPIAGLNVGWIYDYAYETRPGMPIAAGQTNAVSFTAIFSGANEHPANGSGHFGTGSFTLEGNTLLYDIQCDYFFTPTSAKILGPTTPEGDSRKVVADLGSYAISYVPPPWDTPTSTQIFLPGAILYSGSRLLSPAELDELREGRLYVNFASTEFPRGEIRGQIVPDGSIQFSAALTGKNFQPPTGSHNRAEAVLELDGNSLSWEVAVDQTLALKSIGLYTTSEFGKSPRLAIPFTTIYAVLVPSGGFPGAPGTPGQLLYSGGLTLTDEQAAQFRQRKLRVNVITARFPRGEIGSQLVPDDSDQDGIPDYVNTYLTEMFPCDGPWKNHGDYVNAVSKFAGQLVAAGELTIQQYSQIVRQAQHSDCGMKL